jgi:hypothetical protein
MEMGKVKTFQRSDGIDLCQVLVLLASDRALLNIRSLPG